MQVSRAGFSEKLISIFLVIVLGSVFCGLFPKQAQAAAPSKTTITSIDKAAKSLTVKWKKTTAASTTGYQIRYCMNSNMKTGVKTVSATKNAVFKKVSAGIKPATTYYVQVRVAYKSGGKTKYTGWSAKKSTTTMVGSGNSAFDRKVETILSKKVKKTGSAGLKKAFDYVTGLRQGATIIAPRVGDWKKWSVSYAKAMADKSMGNCYQAASLMTWLAKGLGFEARVTYGSYIGGSGKANPHGWSEVKIGGKYYILDANNQNTANGAGVSLNYYKVSKTSQFGKKYIEAMN